MERKLRAVIDTNLFISGIFGKEGSLAAKIQDMWIEEDFEMVTSIEIMKEVSRVLQYPKIRQGFHAKDETIKRFFHLIFRKALITKDIYKTDKVTEDPTDNKFLACALEAKADYIVSGDKHLRNLKQFHGIKIVDAKTFVETINRKKD